MQTSLFNEIRGAIYNPRTDCDALRGYAVALVGEVEKLTESVNRLAESLDRIHGIAYPVQHQGLGINVTPIELAIDKILIDVENTLESLGLRNG